MTHNRRSASESERPLRGGEQPFVRKPAWLALRDLGMEIGVPV